MSTLQDELVDDPQYCSDSDSDSPPKKKPNDTPEKKKRAQNEAAIKLKHRSQKYRKEWENMPEFKGWIAAVPGNSMKAQCLMCKTSLTAELTVIKNHTKSSKHESLKKAIGYGSNQRTLLQYTAAASITKPLDKKVKEAEIRTCGLLAASNIALSFAPKLVALNKKIYSDSEIVKNVNLGRTKATCIMKNVIGRCHFEDLGKELENTKFSAIIDESTDIGGVKTLCVCIRYFCENSGEVQTKFLKLAQIYGPNDADAAREGATAERLLNTMLSVFEDAKIPLSNLIGFASDGCNAMMGTRSGVAVRLNQMLPGITIVKCICHSLHLCCSEACLELPRAPEDLARNIYDFFKNSSKRQAQLAEFQEFCNVDPNKILKPSQTRWLSVRGSQHDFTTMGTS